MCDKESLVGYLYDELSVSEHHEFERHLASCGNCRREVERLRATRTQLALWGPPEGELGFEIVRRPARAGSRFALTPAWGLAAAAVLVLAAASAMANLDVRVGRDGLAIRTGWNRNAGSQSGLQSAASESADAPSRAEVQAIRQRLGELESQLSAQRASEAAVMPVSSGDARLTDRELLRRVQDMVAESEKRQQTALATRVVQVMREMEAAYRTDLVRLQQDITQTQGLRDAEVIRQREMLNQFYRLVGQQR
jgi:Putative zinc-finger